MALFPRIDPKRFIVSLREDKTCSGGWTVANSPVTDDYGYMVLGGNARMAMGVWHKHPVRSDSDPDDVMVQCYYFPTIEQANEVYEKREVQNQQMLRNRAKGIQIDSPFADAASVNCMEFSPVNAVCFFHARYKNYVFNITAAIRQNCVFETVDDFVSYLGTIEVGINQGLNA